MPFRSAWLTITLVAVIALVILQGCSRSSVKSANAPAADEKQLNRPPEETRLIESLEGPALYQAYCAPCHGKDAKGDGPVAPSLRVNVPDLTRISQQNGGQFPTARIQKIISGEEPVAPAHGSRDMPTWGPIFKQIAWDHDLGRLCIYNLTKYLQSIQQK